MSKKKDCLYGRIAIKAVKLFVNKKSKSPLEAWKEAAIEKTTSQSSQKKSCPKNAFLGLCEVGKIKKISGESDTATTPAVNKNYAIKAVEILRNDSTLCTKETELWKKVMKELGKKTSKSQNNQMDVVIALWDKGLIEKR